MNEGKQELWNWFGLSRASFLTLPRAMMHEMPDDWQKRMAQLLNEWDEAWPNFPDVELSATVRKDGKLASVPYAWKNYRHPDRDALNTYRGGPNTDH